MLSLFDKNTFDQVILRIGNLTLESSAQWGKMNVAQMLAHCKEAFKVPLSEKKLPPILLGRLLGWAFKAKLYNDEPWKKNLPTSPNFIIKGERNFENEKKELVDLINRFYHAGPEGISKHPHPFFGKFNPEQWGKSMYKHIDHHLNQFAA